MYRYLYGEDSNHADIARVLSNLAINYNKMGEFSKAEDFNLQSLTMRRYLYGEDSNHVEITFILTRLADNHRDSGE